MCFSAFILLQLENKFSLYLTDSTVCDVAIIIFALGDGFLPNLKETHDKIKKNIFEKIVVAVLITKKYLKGNGFVCHVF